MTQAIGIIPVAQAAKILGLKDTSSIQARGSRYYKYYIPSRKGERRTAKFRINECLRDMARDEEFLEKAKLFTEYLRHIEGITYSEMSKRTNVTVQSIGSLAYGLPAALKICKAFKEYITAFDEYYGWKSNLKEKLRKERDG